MVVSGKPIASILPDAGLTGQAPALGDSLQKRASCSLVNGTETHAAKFRHTHFDNPF